MRKTDDLPGRYKILQQLGEGGTGQVYKVSDSVLGKVISLKILIEADPDAYQALKKEFEILSRLNHPNLVKVHDFGSTASNIPYFTMDYIQGDDLRYYLKNNSTNIREILISIFSALEYLHSRDILHGDIKPENIMISVSSSGEITTTLMDFGLAIRDPSGQKTVSGTLHYLAPEILTESKYSAKSDLYALGISIIDSLTDIKIPVAHKITDDFYKSAYSALNKEFSLAGLTNPSSLSSFIISLCRLESDQRPESADDCLQYLSRLFKLGEKGHSANQRQNFVGRKKDLAFVDAFLEPKNRDKNTLLLLGKTGIGKKSLIQQALTIAQLKGYTTIDTSDTKFNSNSFNRFISTLGTHLPGYSKEKLRKRHNDILESFSLNRDSALPSKEQDMTPVIYDNIVQFLHELSKDNDILISIPDIMRFGPDFIRFINHMIYETDILGSNVKIIISRNTDTSAAKIKSGQFNLLSDSRNLLHHNIEPFTVDELTELLRERFGDILLNNKELDYLLEKSGGIPLYIERIIEYAISSSVIYKDGGNWLLDRKLFSSFDIPDTLSEIVEFVFSDLDKDQLSILQMIASWDRSIRISDLSILLNIPESELLVTITSIIISGILSLNNDIVDFANPSYKVQILKITSYSRRVKNNRKIARHLQNDTRSNPARITRHCIAAQDLDESIEYGLQAIEEYISEYAYYDAYELLSEISSLAKRKGSISRQNQILEQLVSIEIKVGLIAEAAEHFEYLIEHTSDPGKKSCYMTELGKLMDAYFYDKKFAYRLYSDALELEKKSNNTNLIIEIMILKSICGETPDIDLLISASELARENDYNLYAFALSKLIYAHRLSGKIDEMNMAIDNLLHLLNNREIEIHIKRKVLRTLSLAYFYHGDYKNYHYYITQLIEIARTTFNEIDNIYYLSTLGGYYYIQGEYQNLISTLEKVISLSKKYNDHSGAIFAVSNLAGAYRDLAKYDSALALIDEAGVMIENMLKGNSELNVLLKPQTIYVRLGEYFTAKYKPLSSSFQRKAKKRKNLIMLGHGSLLKSIYYYQNLTLSRAISQASKALEYFRKTADRDDIVETLAHLCIYELEKENFSDAASHISEAREIFDEIHCEYLRPFLLFAEGSLAAITEDPQAERILTEALKISLKMGTRENTWQIQRQLALYHFRSGNINKAVSMYRETIETIKQITESVPGEEIKRSYLSLPFRKRVFEEIKSLKSSEDP
ncbi:MAG: protein kinase [Candidatus Krumholzibacteriota bacterium]|nr:protein kinase [Candidatus Krumholzibacteriota bacterium]